MRPQLRFEKHRIRKAELGALSSVPDLVGGLILQNELEFCLDEDDEIYEGMGDVLTPIHIGSTHAIQGR